MSTPRICPETGKIQHPSESAANAAKGLGWKGASTASKRKNRELKPYRCADCGQWHLGHSLGSYRHKHRLVKRARRTNRKGFRF